MQIQIQVKQFNDVHVVFHSNKKCLLFYVIIQPSSFKKPNQHLYGCKNQAQESISPNSHVHYQPSKCIGNIITMGKRRGVIIQMIAKFGISHSKQMLDKDRNTKRKKYWTLIRSQDFGNKKLQCVISIKEEKYRNDVRMQIQI